MSEELLANFTRSEVEATEDLLRCLDGPPTADTFRRMLLLFLRGHYSSVDNYMGFDHLGCWTWDSDPAKRSLEVEFTHQDDDRNPDAYPGVYVGFADVNYERLGVGGNYAGSTNDLAGTHAAKETVANYVISHVARKASDAFDLAELTARVLTAMGPVLARNGGATGFEVLGMRQPSGKKPSPKTHYTVATPVQIKYTLAVTRSLESHRIRMISQIISSTS